MAYFDEAIRDLYYNVGILDIILPFILIFTVIFAVLQRTKVLGTQNGKPMKNFNVVIAIVIAAAAVVPHVLWGSRDATNPRLSNGMLDVVQVINNALPNVSLIVIAVLMFLIIVGIWGKKVDIGGNSLGGIVTVFSIGAIVFIFATAAGWIGHLPNWLYFLQDTQMQTLIVVILVFGLIIRFIVGSDDDDKKKKDKGDSLLKKLSEPIKDAD